MAIETVSLRRTCVRLRAREHILIGHRQVRDVHFLPDFFDGRTAVRAGEDIDAFDRKLGQILARGKEALMLEKLTDQIFLRQAFVFGVCAGGILFVLLREECFALPMKERCGHDEEFAGDVEVQLLNELHIGQVLVRDASDGDLGNVELVALDQIEQEIKRAFKALQPDCNRYSMGHSVATIITKQIDKARPQKGTRTYMFVFLCRNRVIP